MTCCIRITRHKTHCRYEPAKKVVCLSRLPGSFPDTFEAHVLRQQYEKTRQITRSRGLRYSIVISTGEAGPLPPKSIPITWQSIKHCTLTTAVSSLEAYSTPAR